MIIIFHSFLYSLVYLEFLFIDWFINLLLFISCPFVYFYFYFYFISILVLFFENIHNNLWIFSYLVFDLFYTFFYNFWLFLISLFSSTNLFIPIVDSPGYAFLVKYNPNAQANVIFDSILNGWPILVLTVVMAVLAGIIMWMLVSDVIMNFIYHL